MKPPKKQEQIPQSLQQLTVFGSSSSTKTRLNIGDHVLHTLSSL